MSNYYAALETAMGILARDPANRVLGYGLKHGKAKAGFAQVPDEQLALGEMPVAENLMAGVAIGLSLKGLLPVVHYERADFAANAVDAIANHLDKLAEISRGQFRPGVIFRVVVGAKGRPLLTGRTHTQDTSDAWRRLVRFPVYCLRDADEIPPLYELARANQRMGGSTMLFEYRDLY